MGTITDPHPPSTNRRWPALSVVLVAAFMDLMDSTIVTIALPRIQLDVGAGYDEAHSRWP
jgi:hypothetical protein